MTEQKKLFQENADFLINLELDIEKIKNDFCKMKSIEGLPKGDENDILDFSIPPYFTAYPNPYIIQFIEIFGKPYDPNYSDYKSGSFVGDILEGKNDPIYNTHSYHTKVPYKAIISYIKHYNNEGDLIFDGFCGSGMIGGK